MHLIYYAIIIFYDNILLFPHPLEMELYKLY